MAAGAGRCGGGDGPNSFLAIKLGGEALASDAPDHDAFATMTRWVESGRCVDVVAAMQSGLREISCRRP